MAVSEAHKRSSYKWNSSRDQITLRPTKEAGAKIRAAAATEGLSIQQFILKAVWQQMGIEPEEDQGTEPNETEK